MTREQLKKHLKLEKQFGPGFLPTAPRDAEWDSFVEACLGCTGCKLHSTRTQVVFGVGDLKSPLLFVGEGPGEQEDLKGEPFIGRAGQLLTKTLRKFGVERAQVYIANIVKCRPPGNRTPQPDEVTACMPHLRRQIQKINPKVICTLGGPSTKALLNTTKGITSMRGRYHTNNDLRILPTFHPAYVLRNMSAIGTLETDIQKALTDSGLIS